jgi:hypothetical protein
MTPARKNPSSAVTPIHSVIVPIRRPTQQTTLKTKPGWFGWRRASDVIARSTRRSPTVRHRATNATVSASRPTMPQRSVAWLVA